MSLRKWIKKRVNKQKEKFYGSIIKRMEKRLSYSVALGATVTQNQQKLASKDFELCLLSAARNIAMDRDFHVQLPMIQARLLVHANDLKIGYFGNIANNAYNFIKSLRRLAYKAELVVEDGFFDAFLLNRPFWEDVSVTCENYEEGLPFETKWQQPSCVIRVAYDPQLQARYAGRLDAIPEVQALYQEAFGKPLPEDRALLLAQHMGHWPYLLAMKRYDIVQFSGASISMAPFCPKPYVVFPTGSDLFISPFEETLFGLMIRAGYRNASHILNCEVNYPEYLYRLQVSNNHCFAPMLIDTDTYSPHPAEPQRQEWQQKVGGEIFLLSVCRQAWQWKGNDIFLRAFAKADNERMRLVLMGWGPDMEKSRALIQELGLTNKVVWEPLCSKPVLRLRQNAADLVVDQLVMTGYGTSVLESMAAAKPVMMRFEKSENVGYFDEMPPFIAVKEEADIVRVLNNLPDLEKIGQASRQWVLDTHGYQKIGPQKYIDPCLRSLYPGAPGLLSFNSSQAETALI